jgi:DNA ligase-1
MEHDMERGGLTRRQLIGGLTAALAAWHGGSHAAAPTLLLARDAPADVDPAGFLVSEKLDGVRALWDGRMLRTRSGLVVAAPGWFAARLPAVPLDGELWMGRGRFEPLCAAVRRRVPRDDEWRGIGLHAFDLPAAAGPFAARAARLLALARSAGSPSFAAVEQLRVADRAELRRRLDAVVHAGGEGLVLHRADAPFHTGRSDALLKLKPIDDADAVVVGHVPGRGRLAGRMGALQVRDADGRHFQIGTGFDDATRSDPPPVGSTVTYTHRGRTAYGVPRFASYLRVRPDL